MLRFTSVLLLIAAASIASTPSALPATTQEVLRRAGRSAEDFLKQIQSVNCVETVRQAKLDRKGKAVFEQESVFDYLVVFQLTADDLVFEESRTQMPQPASRKKAETRRVALLATSGFPTFQFILHPFYQSSFEYSAPEFTEQEGKRLLSVRFRHVHGTHSPSVLRLKSREYSVEWQGTAWLDPESGAVVRISASLLSPMDDIGLTVLNAEVRYEAVRFKDDPMPHLLPASATIEAESSHQRWRNTHSFAQYRHFAVDVKTEMETLK